MGSASQARLARRRPSTLSISALAAAVAKLDTGVRRAPRGVRASRQAPARMASCLRSVRSQGAPGLAASAWRARRLASSQSPRAMACCIRPRRPRKAPSRRSGGAPGRRRWLPPAGRPGARHRRRGAGFAGVSPRKARLRRASRWAAVPSPPAKASKVRVTARSPWTRGALGPHAAGAAGETDQQHRGAHQQVQHEEVDHGERAAPRGWRR